MEQADLMGSRLQYWYHGSSNWVWLELKLTRQSAGQEMGPVGSSMEVPLDELTEELLDVELAEPAIEVAVDAVAVVITCCTTGKETTTSDDTAPVVVSTMAKLPFTAVVSSLPAGTKVLKLALPTTLSVAVPPVMLVPVLPAAADTFPPAPKAIAPLPALMLARTMSPAGAV